MQKLETILGNQELATETHFQEDLTVLLIVIRCELWILFDMTVSHSRLQREKKKSETITAEFTKNILIPKAQGTLHTAWKGRFDTCDTKQGLVVLNLYNQG